jgi:hypothetical protein
LSFFWMYAAVSVCTQKLIRLSSRNSAASEYRLRVACRASASGSRPWKVERRLAGAGRGGES